ncbi:hypothetical protein PVAG01_09062 [Phlyctema vagabunda]|uniref:Uncharacterized protein n=1 Tax=Phlyctema vagabunda TaxID=108571 RepID=A0ABR4P6A4_9HELO
MGGFADISLANKFGIILGILIFLTFVAGFVKVYLNRKRLIKATRQAGMEVAKGHNAEKYNAKKFMEGDLFGVRAIENGYFGGVAQSNSRPTSPAIEDPMSPKSISNMTVQPYPPAKVYAKPISPIRAMSPSRRLLVTRPPRSPRLASLKPSPLRLQSRMADVEYGHQSLLNQSHELTPISAARSDFNSSSAQSVSSVDSRDDWISPLDMHFDRPMTPNSPLSSRSYGYTPRLQFPEDDTKNPVFIIGQSETAEMIKSQAAAAPRNLIEETMRSAGNSPTSYNPTGQPHSQKIQTPVFSLFPGNTSPRLQSPRRPGTAQSSAPPNKPSAEADPFANPDSDSYPSPPESGDERTKRRAGLRDSAVVVNQVLHYGLEQNGMLSPRFDTDGNLGNPWSSRSSDWDSRSPSADSRKPAETKRSESAASSSRSFSRTRDSIQSDISHARNESVESQRSRDRDVIHYDPTEQQRNRSESVQGRNVDFDYPRTNPFVDANAIQEDRITTMKVFPGGDFDRPHARFAAPESQHSSIGSLADSYFPGAVHVAQRAQSISNQGNFNKTKIVEVSFSPRGRQLSQSQNWI